MRSLKRVICLMLVFLLVVQDTKGFEIGAATAKGTTLRLEATEGTVELTNSAGTAKTIKSGMKLYKGDVTTTSAKSYAYISLDGTKAVKLDENSSAYVKQNGKENEVMLSEGNLLFNVTVPLKKKESLNIRTSTMVTGVRGTIGVSKRVSDDESILYLLEGHTEVKYIDNVTGKLKTAKVAAGQLLTVKRIKGKAKKNTLALKATIRPFTEEEIDEFVIIEIGRNKDIQDRLRRGGIFDVDKILGMYKRLGDKGTYYTLGKKNGNVSSDAADPDKVTSGNAVSGNAVTTNNAEGGGAGGGVLRGAAGGGGGAGTNNNTNNTGNITIQSANQPNSSYAINSAITPLSVLVNAPANGIVSYQWYSSDTSGQLGQAINGATADSFTPPSNTLGTTYYTCVATVDPGDGKTVEKKSEQYKITVLQKNNISNVASPAAPDYNDIGFNYITVPAVTTYTPAAVSVHEGIDAGNGTIRIQGRNPYSLIKNTLELDDPGTASIPEGCVIEYACVTSNTAPAADSAWQTDRTFTNLVPATTYYAFSRAKGTTEMAASEPSAACEVSTKGGQEVTYDTTEHIEYKIVSSNGVYTAACGFEYHPEKSGAGEKYFNYNGEIRIPSTISCFGMEVPVTGVFEKGFYGDFQGGTHYNSFSNGSIVLPDSIKVIGDYAFDSIVVPNGIKLGSGIEKIGDNAFSNTIVLFDVFPQGVKEIGNLAFAGCGSITQLALPEGLEKVGNGAFQGCASLTELNFPDGLTDMGSGIFLNCGNLGTVDLPDNMTVVSANYFQNCSNLRNVTIPDTVTEIGNSAFYGCTNLRSVDLPDSVRKIGSYAFYGCKTITSIHVPSGVTVINPGTFQECTALREIFLPGTVTSIKYIDEKTGSNQQYPFRGCSSLKMYFGSETIPAGIDTWGKLSDDAEYSGINVKYYKEVDRNTVELYSTDCTKYPTGDDGMDPYKIQTLDIDSDCAYNYYINTDQLEWALANYDRVVIPEGNIAILDRDLSVSDNKTLEISGQLSTNCGWYDEYGGKFKLTTNSSYGIYWQRSGDLINHGTVVVSDNGCFYTTFTRQHNNSNATIPYGTVSSNDVNSRFIISAKGEMTIFDVSLSADQADYDQSYYLSINRLELMYSGESEYSKLYFKGASSTDYYDMAFCNAHNLCLKYRGGYYYPANSLVCKMIYKCEYGDTDYDVINGYIYHMDDADNINPFYSFHKNYYH